MVIEQEQILTTHNLAVLVAALDLTMLLGPRLDELARRCFAWICRRQGQRIDDWQARLRMVKNSAYAWRQIVFFLALLPVGAVDAFLIWAYEHLAEQPPAVQTRLQPALQGLALIAAGGSLDEPYQQSAAGPARRFLGWTTGRHWLLGEE
jgi:hypothetical protein